MSTLYDDVNHSNVLSILTVCYLSGSFCRHVQGFVQRLAGSVISSTTNV